MKTCSVALSVLILVNAGLATGGCVSSRVIRRDDLRSGDTFARSVVFVQDGSRYEFVRLAVYPDTVVGEYKVTLERESEKDGLYYEDETHAHHMALATVDSVAVLHRDPVKTLLYTAGAAGVGVLVYEAINTSDSGKKD